MSSPTGYQLTLHRFTEFLYGESTHAMGKGKDKEQRRCIALIDCRYYLAREMSLHGSMNFEDGEH